MIIDVSAIADIRRAKNLFIALLQKSPLEKEEFFSYLPPSLQKLLASFAHKEFRGEDTEIKLFWNAAGAPPERIVLFGLGSEKQWHARAFPLIARRMVQYAKRERIQEFMAVCPSPDEYAVRNFAVNALMAHFEYVAYKTPPKDGWPEVRLIHLALNQKEKAAAGRAVKDGRAMGEEVNACRILVNMPGSDMTPARLADAARAAGKRTGVKVIVLDEQKMKRICMGGILGVSRGSTEKPKFIILEYFKGARNEKPLILAGKGVTFDTGGVNLKPEQHMQEMHMDMSGGAAVIHGIAAIARLKLAVNVVGLIPAVENMPSGSSYRPGDLLKSLSGKTIEVLNTDAEGRIILADALAYGLRYKPGLIADFATLTGAAHVALGNYCSALFTNREDLMQKFIEIGTRSGDYVWPLPLWDEYLADIRGTFGDLTNIAKQDRYGGAIHGAKFLEQFVDAAPWAHIDIAPRMTAVDSEYLAKGASGVGVRYIVELAKAYPQILNPKS